MEENFNISPFHPRMSQGIVLTQYSPHVAAAQRHPAPLPAGYPRASIVQYRSLDPVGEGGCVEYCDDLSTLPPLASWAQANDGVARYACELAQDSGPASEPHRVLMIVAFCVPEERTAEVERWYVEEHAPLLLRAPGWLRMRRYHLRSFAGGPCWTSLALHELADVKVLDSAERKYARSTAWRAQLEKEAWFAQAGRWVYERLAA